MNEAAIYRSSSLTTRRDALTSLASGAATFAAAGSLSSTLFASPGTAATPIGETIVPFQVAVPQSQIEDLKLRLRLTRWPEHETVPDWSQGVPLGKAKALAAYWHDRYDWRRFERKLNAFPQFRTQIDGLGIHFLNVRSKHAGALPIILTHGWPGSVVEFLKVIGPLTDPTSFGGTEADAFHVVIPSMPGFGWSDKPAKTGWNVARTASAWATLMGRFGYNRWVAQGGDWGSAVTHALGKQRPQGLIAAHVNWPFVFPGAPPAAPTDVEKAAFAAATKFATDQAGYFQEQSTRPQTIGYGLTDSPIGQATWIYEKMPGLDRQSWVT